MKYTYKHVIFDLDGTISDSREGIYNAYRYAIQKLGIESPGQEVLKTLIGPPLQKGFAEVFKLEGRDNENAVKVFREYYADKGLYENNLYEGMYMLLEDLNASGVCLYVATAKYLVYAKQVLKYFGIEHFFTEIAGADYEGKHAGKLELIAGILRRNGITDPEEVVVIGDTKYDIDAAKELEIDSAGVAYGFTSYEEIISFDPEYVVRNIEDLREILFKE
jgi:phosphoglycolate phosphatase